jgi:hypothetical protein
MTTFITVLEHKSHHGIPDKSHPASPLAFSPCCCKTPPDFSQFGIVCSERKKASHLDMVGDFASSANKEARFLVPLASV